MNTEIKMKKESEKFTEIKKILRLNLCVNWFSNIIPS